MLLINVTRNFFFFGVVYSQYTLINMKLFYLNLLFNCYKYAFVKIKPSLADLLHRVASYKKED